jgi:integrase
MVTVGKNSKGRPIVKTLKPQSHFETYNEAYEALVEYAKNPYDLDDAITVKQLYDRWSVAYFGDLESASAQRTITSSWAYCSSVYDMRACDLRARHVKGCMDEGVAIFKGKEHHTTPGIKARIKSLFNLMLDYALEYEIVDRNYARTFDISGDILREREETKRGHLVFSDDEFAELWNHVNDIKYVDIVLIQCYSGWRPQELGLIRMENVDLKNWTFTGGIKTDAGKDRIVPIHSKIRKLVEARYKEAQELHSDYLFNCTDGLTHLGNIKLTYDKYANRFNAIRDRLKLNPLHRAHDPRKHFVTMAKKAGVDEYAIKRIVGHAINDITEKVYTDRDVDWLKSEIEKI